MVIINLEFSESLLFAPKIIIFFNSRKGENGYPEE